MSLFVFRSAWGVICMCLSWSISSLRNRSASDPVPSDCRWRGDEQLLDPWQAQHCRHWGFVLEFLLSHSQILQMYQPSMIQSCRLSTSSSPSGSKRSLLYWCKPRQYPSSADRKIFCYSSLDRLHRMHRNASIGIVASSLLPLHWKSSNTEAKLKELLVFGEMQDHGILSK